MFVSSFSGSPSFPWPRLILYFFFLHFSPGNFIFAIALVTVTEEIIYQFVSQDMTQISTGISHVHVVVLETLQTQCFLDQRSRSLLLHHHTAPNVIFLQFHVLGYGINFPYNGINQKPRTNSCYFLFFSLQIQLIFDSPMYFSNVFSSFFFISPPC